MAKRITREFERLLVEWRVKLNMTQAQMAEEMGVAQVTVSKWERGVSRATRKKEFEVLLWAFERNLIDKSPQMQEDEY